MNTLDDLRTQYGRYSDRELRMLLAGDAASLTAEARQALAEEAMRRGMVGQMEPAPLVRPPANADDVWHYPKAPLGKRFVALLIDSFFGIAMPVIAGLIGVVTSHGRMNAINVMLLVSSVLWAIYYNFTKDGHDDGRSFGKRVMGLMVVHIKTNRPCTMGQSALRALLLMALNWVPLLGTMIEPLVAIVQPDGRRVGDMAAGTQVIEARLFDGNLSS